MKMKFSAGKIYYNFSQDNPKIKSIQNTHRVYMHFNVLVVWLLGI